MVADIMTTDPETGDPVVDQEATLRAKNTLGVGTFKLTDIRDSHPYLVRRLADGNCWMVENLDLALADFAGTENLTSENTDLNSKSVWDPAASTLAKARTFNPSADMTNYFSIASLNLLGTDQGENQFQPSDIAGTINGVTYHWGSRFNESGEPIVSTDGTNTTAANGSANTNRTYVTDNGGFWVENNSRSQIPRSYNVDYYYVIDDSLYNPENFSTGSDIYWNVEHASNYVGGLYNVYSLSAESVDFITVSGTASDSICPRGWTLVDGDSYTVDKTWRRLMSVYKDENGDTLGDNGASARAMMNIPISLPLGGVVSYAHGKHVSAGREARFATKTITGTTSIAYLIVTGNQAAKINYASKAQGLTVRCVSHGNELNSQESQEAVATTCTAGKICYDGNGGTGSMTDQSASANASVVLTAPTYTRLGYSFAGWSTQDNGFGTVYGPNETITAPSDIATNGLRLYAKWLPSTGTMQDFTTAQCNALGTHQSVALTDNRDGNTYTVTKLKDGNCWMTTNLALNLADFAGDNPKSGYLTTANTDIGNDKDGSGNPTRTDLIDLSSTGGGNSGLYRWDPEKSSREKFVALGLGTAAEYNFSDLAETLLGQAQPAQFQSADQTGYIWGSIYQDADDGNGRRTYSGAKIDNTEGSAITIDGNVVKVANNANAEMPRSYLLGASQGSYYTYYASTAESGKLYGTKTATDSICPVGWQLPLPFSASAADKTWENLITASYALSNNSESALKTRMQPLSFKITGYYGWNSGLLDWNTGDTIFASSATANTGGGAGEYYMRTSTMIVRESGPEPNYGWISKPSGVSVRCVKK